MSEADEFVFSETEAGQRETALRERVKLLEARLGMVEGYAARAKAPPTWAASTRRTKTNEAVCTLQFSDLHLDEFVDPRQTMGLSAFNREIGDLRLRAWADKACELSTRFSHDWRGSYIFANGDFVSGAIHDELLQTNEAFLPETLVHYAPLIAGGFGQVIRHHGKRGYVAVEPGNHGRLTEKMTAKNRVRNSWDWLLMQMVKAHLDRETDLDVTWDFGEASAMHVQVYDRTYFVTHGDEVKGGGGWAGVWSPLGTICRKAIELGNAMGIRTYCCIVGHWHQCVLAHAAGRAVNSSLKGYDEFAMKHRFAPEPPSQNWAAHTPERGVTVAAPILVENRKREGW